MAPVTLAEQALVLNASRLRDRDPSHGHGHGHVVRAKGAIVCILTVHPTDGSQDATRAIALHHNFFVQRV